MKTNVLVIGGGPSGIVTALTAKQRYPGKEVTIVRREKYVVVPCGIPYIFGTLKSVEKDRISDEGLKKKGVDIVVDEVIDLDLKSKKARLRGGEEILFDKLVLATGSKPSIPPIKGVELRNVFPVRKDPEHLKAMLEAIQGSERVTIIGGGFIGVEFADDLASAGYKVTLIELLPHILALSFDDEFCELAEAKLRELGVELRTGTKVVRIEGKEEVEAVVLENGERIKSDVVILATGAKPNTELAEKAGLKVSRYGVEVDEYLRTSHPDVFAVGDCAEKRDFFTRKPKSVMLASVATAEARVAGANLYKITSFRQMRGTVGIFATKVGDLALGAAGLIERVAKREGFDYVVGTSKVLDKHPGALPGAHEVRAKLIFTRHGGFFLGGQLAGGFTIGEMINLIGFAIEAGFTAAQYMNLQIGTHPFLTPPPTAPATLKATEDALRKIYPD